MANAIHKFPLMIFFAAQYAWQVSCRVSEQGELQLQQISEGLDDCAKFWLLFHTAVLPMTNSIKVRYLALNPKH